MLTKKDEYLENLELRMGLSGPKTTDVIRREDFDSDDAYLDAATRHELERERDPRYNDVRRKFEIQLAQEKEKARKAAQDKRFNELRDQVKVDRASIDERATVAATADLNSGRISPKEFGEAKEKHAKKIEDQDRRDKASNIMFNEFVRDEIRRNRVSGNA